MSTISYRGTTPPRWCKNRNCIPPPLVHWPTTTLVDRLCFRWFALRQGGGCELSTSRPDRFEPVKEPRAWWEQRKVWNFGRREIFYNAVSNFHIYCCTSLSHITVLENFLQLKNKKEMNGQHSVSLLT